MSTQWTYQDLDTKVRNDLDMTEELIVTPAEMLGYANAAVEEAQAEITTIYEDYYLTQYPLTLVTGQSLYTLPEGIYIEKIRRVVYSSGNIVYAIRQFRGATKFEEIARALLPTYVNDDYKYYLTNPSVSDGYGFNLAPLSRETGQVVTIWYIREATSFVEMTDVLDIPQFAQFVIEFMKGMCKAKENGGQMPPDAAAMIEQKRKLMVDTLSRMIPDDDDKIQGDFTAYTEMS